MHRLLLIFTILTACTLPQSEFAGHSNKPPREKALIYSEIALNAFGLNRYYKAEKFFRLASYYLPQSTKIKFNLSLTLINLEQYEEARAILNTLYKAQPNNITYILSLAKSYNSEGDFLRALMYYDRAKLMLEKSKDYNKLDLVYRNLAELYFIKGYEEEALCFSDMSFKSKNKNLEASHLALMSALNMFSDILENKDLLREAREIRDENIIFWYVLANYARESFKESYFLARVVESELISDGNIVGFDYVFDKLKNVLEYTELSDKSKDFEHSELERNYWPQSILVN